MVIPASRGAAIGTRPPFLRPPPFPGAKQQRLEPIGDGLCDPESVHALLRHHRVGGAFWGPQPALPDRYLLVRTHADLASIIPAVGQDGPQLVWPLGGSRDLPDDCDPWHMLSGAAGLYCEEGDEVAAIAAVLELPTFLPNGDRSAFRLSDMTADGASVATEYVNPFNGTPMSGADALALCGFWRTMIDANRSIGSGLGFAFWKRKSVLPLLWSGGDAEEFFCDRSAGDASRAVAVWRSKTPARNLEQLERTQTPIVEVEDGFLRSDGLGADCVPPLSITVDRLGPYFDPGQPSELEVMLQTRDFTTDELARARRLRDIIVTAGLGKYGQGQRELQRFDPARQHILVTGQVEDDRSVLTGGSGLVSNFDLLQRVRSQRPDAYIIYKPHPDVLAGHRQGAIPRGEALRFADNIVADEPISSLIALVDEVHVNTSLAGFEALMRQKQVTTYGVPFYAGWGLTTDLGPVPSRRSRHRSLDELVAATLLAYPRYLDPVTGLPCPAEVVVDRLTTQSGSAGQVGALVWLRRLQGRAKQLGAAWRMR